MKKPNIIYILADDMGYGDVSCLNPHPVFQTPNIDSLGTQGAVFTDAHSSSAVCTPSRYSILTGRYNWRSRLKKGVLGGYSPSLIEEKRQTVAHLLKDHGYATFCIGKWHLGMDWGINNDLTQPVSNGPNAAGFDYYYGISASLDMPPYVYIENDRVTEQPDHEYEGIMPDSPQAITQKMARKGPCAPSFHHEEVLPNLTKKVLDVIEANKNQPFFLYFPLTAPHTPILPAKEFLGKSGTNLYGDFCLMCDDVVGQILRKLEELGIDEHTILIYTSDNGCSPQADFEELRKMGHDPSAGFRGQKADIYEGGHRIPLLIRWPDVIQPGLKVTETVCLSDFMATVADILEISLPDTMGEDSVSNLSLWKGDTKPVREAIVHQSIDGSLSIRKGNLKLEMCPGSGGWSYPRPGKDSIEGMPEFQLYDLENDPAEQKNLIGTQPEAEEALKQLLIHYIKNGRSTPGYPQSNDGAPIWETIRWLEQ